jgi:hypothetical protein
VTKTIRRVAVVVGALALTAGTGLFDAASAARPARQGWWRASLVFLGVDLTAVLDPSSADVPADGLLVSGGSTSEQPQAYAAVAYDLGGRSLAGPLRLAPHPTAASVPESGAVACPLDSEVFEPAHGGRVEDGPGYDCLGAVNATIADDGAYLFDVSTLQRGDTVAVAILPANATSRIVFAPPGDDSLPLGEASSPGPPGPVADVPAPAGAGLTDNLSPSPVDVSPAAPVVGPSEGGAAPAPAGFGTPIPTGSDRGSAGRAYVLLGLAAAAGAAWVVAGRPRPRRVVPQ